MSGEVTRRRTGARGPLLALLVLTSGCGSRQLSEPTPMEGPSRFALGLAVALCGVLLVFHVARWLLGRNPGLRDQTALIVSYEALACLVAAALIVLCHLRAEELLGTAVGDEPELIVELHAECGVTTGDDFLEFHTNYESCSVNGSGLTVVVPLVALASGLLLLGRGLRDGRGGRGGTGAAVLALLAPVPISVLAGMGLLLVAPDLAELLFWATAAPLVFGILAVIDAVTSNRRDRQARQSLR